MPSPSRLRQKFRIPGKDESMKVLHVPRFHPASFPLRKRLSLGLYRQATRPNYLSPFEGQLKRGFHQKATRSLTAKETFSLIADSNYSSFSTLWDKDGTLPKNSQEQIC